MCDSSSTFGTTSNYFSNLNRISFYNFFPLCFELWTHGLIFTLKKSPILRHIVDRVKNSLDDTNKTNQNFNRIRSLFQNSGFSWISFLIFKIMYSKQFRLSYHCFLMETTIIQARAWLHKCYLVSAPSG